jgi:hypothetical protein
VEEDEAEAKRDAELRAVEAAICGASAQHDAGLAEHAPAERYWVEDLAKAHVKVQATLAAV